MGRMIFYQGREKLITRAWKWTLFKEKGKPRLVLAKRKLCRLGWQRGKVKEPQNTPAREPVAPTAIGDH